ncbi:uncharacterized protein LOC134848059 [Symsagittifera roscoffensis]|uniref:uncharacterized protein LOC134848059 n=1 Tax=Symsagittifera roscoffensis TaxID=84072 RepID=UPI00307B3C25
MDNIFILALSLATIRFSNAEIALVEYEDATNSSGIAIGITMTFTPGTLYRDESVVFQLNSEGWFFDNGYTDGQPGYGLEQGRAYSYRLEDNIGRDITEIFCTHPAPAYDLRTTMLNETLALVVHTRIPASLASSYYIGLLELDKYFDFFEGHDDFILDPAPAYDLRTTMLNETLALVVHTRIPASLASGYYIGLLELDKYFDYFDDNPFKLSVGTQVPVNVSFTNLTFVITQAHICPKTEPVEQRSEYAISNTIRTRPNDVGLSTSQQTTQTSIELNLATQDSGYGLDYILYRDDVGVKTFSYPLYSGLDEPWTDTDLSPGIKYKFQLKAEDSFSGITVMSDYVIVCTNPPDPIQLVCSLNAETMMAEINWEIPQGNYGANLESQISKDVNNQPIHVAGGTAYSWPASLDPSASHSFSARLFFTCPTGDAGAKYSNWVSVSVEAATPVLSVVLLNQSTVSINLQHFQNYRNIRLFIDGIMRDPQPSVFPLKISGLEANRIYVFEAQATQFSQDVQSNSVSLQTPYVEQFVCPAPSQPERVSFEPIGSNGIKLNWLAAPVPTYEDRSPDSEVFYEVKISGGRTETGITKNMFDWPEQLASMTLYILSVRSAFLCEQNNEKTVSNWVQINAYTAPAKPNFIILEEGEDFVELQLENYRQYDSVTLFVDGQTIASNPQFWPFVLRDLNNGRDYKLAVVVEKFGLHTDSDVLTWPTERPVNTASARTGNSDESNLAPIIGSVVGGLVALILLAVLVVAIIFLCRKNEGGCGGSNQDAKTVDTEYEEPANYYSTALQQSNSPTAPNLCNNLNYATNPIITNHNNPNMNYLNADNLNPNQEYDNQKYLPDYDGYQKETHPSADDNQSLYVTAPPVEVQDNVYIAVQPNNNADADTKQEEPNA